MKSDWPADHVERRAIEALIPYVNNARTHSDAQVAQIAASMKEWGWTNPILVDETGLIIAGHGRVMAARKLGLTEAPVMVAKGWTEAQKKAYVLADNQLAANAGWNAELLSTELKGLDASGFDLTLLGFGDLGALLADKTEGLTDPDEAPPLPETPITLAGDVWLLGSHRIICGDSTDAETVKALMNGKSAELCLTDPPYGIGYGYNEHDDSDNDANADLVAKVFALAPPAKVWSPGGNNLARDIVRFGKAKVLYWHKRFAAAGNGLGGASTVEPVLVVGPPKHRALANDYLDFKTDRVEVAGKSLRELHPCPKPAALYAHLAEAFCAKGGAIYEPFSGSGTTLIAAEMTGRRCFAIELSPAYVDVAVRRWEAFTDRAAVLESTGQSFAKVRLERGRQAA